MHAWLIAALVVSWVLVFALAGALYVLIKQHGELIVYQHDLDHRLEIGSFFEGTRAGSSSSEPAGTEMQGLPVGVEAPTFHGLDLDGKERSLADYRGQEFVLTFFSETCGYCKDMAGDLGVLPSDARKVVILSHGDVHTHKDMARDNNWHAIDVLIEPEYEAMTAYGAMGTPSGYLIDAEGKIASKLALGGGPVMDLVLDRVPPDVEEPPAETNGHAADRGPRIADAPPPQNGNGGAETASATATALKTRDVSESKIARDGLEPGTEAPNFVLQDLDGKTHSLVDYRGKPVLLVFSDVDCAPCELLSPPLVELAEKKDRKLQVIMISRGDEEQNREKAKAFGYPFPVLRQRSWEISKLYGMFATPIGYLIDKDGIIEKEVAVGPEPILELV